jgi:hypothetical protein
MMLVMQKMEKSGLLHFDRSASRIDHDQADLKGELSRP